MTTMKELERKINELDKRTDDKCDKYFDNADRLGRVESVLAVMTIFLIVAVAASLVALAHDTPSLPSGYEEVCVNTTLVRVDSRYGTSGDTSEFVKLYGDEYIVSWKQTYDTYGLTIVCEVKRCTAYQLVRRVAE